MKTENIILYSVLAAAAGTGLYFGIKKFKATGQLPFATASTSSPGTSPATTGASQTPGTPGVKYANGTFFKDVEKGDLFWYLYEDNAVKSIDPKDVLVAVKYAEKRYGAISTIGLTTGEIAAFTNAGKVNRKELLHFGLSGLSNFNLLR